MTISVRNIVLFLLLLLLPMFGKGQQDSRQLNEQGSTFHQDTALVSELISEAKRLRHRNTDSGITLFGRAVTESRRINYNDGLARSITGLGLYYMDKGEYNKSYAYYQLALPFCKASDFQGGVLLVGLYNNIAALYGNRGLSDSAALFYYKSLGEMERRQIKDTNLLILIYSNLGGRLASEKQTSQAKFYLQKGEALAKATGNIPRLAKIYVSMAALHGALGERQESRNYAFKALKIFDRLKDPASEASANCIIAQSYLEENRPKTAIRYYTEALSDHVNASRIQRSVALRGLGASYYALKDFTKAEEYYKKVLRIAKKEKLNKGIMDCYKALVAIYSDRGDYRLALQYKNDYEAMQDSTVNAERLASINHLEVKYRTSEKDKELTENKLLLHQKEALILRKNRLIATIVGGSLLSIALLGALYKNRRHRQKIALLKMENEREVNLLRANMEGEEKERVRIARELHDGIMVQFSSAQMNLGALIEKTDLADSDEMEKILVQLEAATKELRKSAHNLMPDMLLQEGLADATHYFCKTLELSASIDIEFHLIGQLPSIAPEYELMLYRIIQELLQNTVKHSRASHVLVQLNCHGDMISINVEDNGIGFDDTSSTTREGMGLRGIRSRLKSLNGTVSIHNNPGGGASVYIEVESSFLKKPVVNTNVYKGSYN